MSQVSATELRLSDLDRQIARLQNTANAIKRARLPFESKVARASWLTSRLKFKKWLRGPARNYELWKVGLILVPAVPLLVFGFFGFVSGSFGNSSAVFSGLLAFGGIGLAGLLFRLLYCPTDAQLTVLIVEAEIESRVAIAELNNLKSTDGLDDVQVRLGELRDERKLVLTQLRKEVASGIRKRTELLQRNWKAMRDYEWENYLVEVFRALGASRASRIGGSGDQGVDLIVESNGKRIAVQAKGYLHAVSNKAVQEAYTGMVHHRCCACVVITNSRFTSSARELAASTNCMLIGEDEFPDFVMGKLDLCRDL